MPAEGIEIKKSEKLTLTIEEIIGFRKNKETTIPVQYKDILKDVKKGDIVMIDDGLIEIKVETKTKNSLITKVKVGGILKSHKGINVPTASISAKSITEKDRKDLNWGLEQDVDYIALSFVKSAKDIEELRKLIKAKNKTTKIIAKIERHEAIGNLKEIILASDAIMVARGDLGIEIPAETVPIVQKRMIRIANKYGKPIITATQILQSMVENAIPTRAEISDAANAVFDHTDAIMLSNESAVGKYASKATAVLRKVAETVENDMQKYEEIRETFSSQYDNGPTNAICRNACELAVDTKADMIVVYTEDGYTAKEIAKSRIYNPIVTITPDKKIARELTLVWGLNHIINETIKGKQSEKTEKIIQILKKYKLLKKNANIVIVSNASKKEKLISNYQT
jgi:pyruvate kinase